MAGFIFSKGSGINDSVYGKSQEPIKAVIEQNIEAFQETSMIDKIYYMDKSTNFAEKYTQLTSLGDFKNVGENGAYPVTSLQQGYEKVIEPFTWKSKFEITAEMVEDQKYGATTSRANAFALSYGRTREKYGALMLAGGINKTATIGGTKYNTSSADGEALFSQNHPSITKGTKVQSNIFKAAFSETALDTVQEKMQNFTDDDGNIMNVAPDTIIIPNRGDLKRAVFAAVGSELDPNTNNNAVNFQLGLWNVLVWPYLPTSLTSDGKPYFILMDSKFNKNYMALPWVDRLALTVKSDIDPNTDANVWKGRARFAAGFNNWRAVAICGETLTGTTLS